MNLYIFSKLFAFAYFFAIADFISLEDTTPVYFLIENISFIICLIVFCAKKFSSALFYALLFSVIIEFAYILPHAPNHRHVLFFAALISLFSFSKEELFQRRTLPAIRWLTIIVYFFAFFAKLNWGYLDPKTSCSVLFYGNILKTFPFLPQGEFVNYFVIYSSIIIEAILPLLLLFRPAWGLLLGVLFHAGLALDIYKYFINFSSVMFLCLSSFIEKDSVSRFFSERRKQISLLSPFFIIGVILTIIAEYYNDIVLNHLFGYSFLVKYIFWYGLVVYIIYLVYFMRRQSSFSYRLNNKVYFFEILIVLIAFLNGLSPYLGLKTRTSFNMYSNMQITSKDSNHLISPKSLDIFNFLKDFEESGEIPKGVIARKLLIFRNTDFGNSGKCIW